MIQIVQGHPLEWYLLIEYKRMKSSFACCFFFQIAIAAIISDSATEDVIDEEFDIVSLCTDIPNLFSYLMMAYANMNGENATLIFQNLVPLVEKLKKKMNAIKFALPAYTEAVAETDSVAVSLQNQMISVFQQLETAIEELYAHLEDAAETDNMQIRPSLERVHIIQDEIKPAIVAFRKSCMAETEDILNNVIQSVDQS